MFVVLETPVTFAPTDFAALRAIGIVDLLLEQLPEHAEPNFDRQRQQPLLCRPHQLAQRLPHPLRQHGLIAGRLRDQYGLPTAVPPSVLADRPITLHQERTSRAVARRLTAIADRASARDPYRDTSGHPGGSGLPTTSSLTVRSRGADRSGSVTSVITRVTAAPPSLGRTSVAGEACGRARVYWEHIARCPGGRRQCFHGQCAGRRSPIRAGARVRRSARPFRTGMRRVARADHMAIVKPPLLGPDRVADAAPRLHEMVDVAPPGHQPPRRTFQRSPASSLSTRRTAFSEPAPT